MRRTPLALIAALALLPAVAHAGPPSLEGERAAQFDPARRAARMAEQLDLSPEQTEAITARIESAQSEIEPLHSALREAMEALFQAREAGDEKAMRRGLKEVDALKEEIYAARLGLRDGIRSELDLEQQVALEELEMRRHRHEREMMDRVRRFLGEGEPPDRR